jgi:formate dehydrogenase major subunit
MALLKEHDFGTPAKPGPATVRLTVDGREVAVPEGTSVMRAAAEADVDIPKLCTEAGQAPQGRDGAVHLRPPA